MNTGDYQVGDEVRFVGHSVYREPHRLGTDQFPIKHRLEGLRGEVVGMNGASAYSYPLVVRILDPLDVAFENPNLPDFVWNMRCFVEDIVPESEWFNHQFPQQHFSTEEES